MFIFRKSCQRYSLRNTMKMLFVCGMDVAREQYKVNYYCKHEIVLLDTCLFYLYLTTYWVGQYSVTYHKNITHISNMLSHDVQSYRDTFFPWPCLQRYCKYDNHKVVLKSYSFQKYDWIFHQNFCFAHCDFYV